MCVQSAGSQSDKRQLYRSKLSNKRSVTPLDVLGGALYTEEIKVSSPFEQSEQSFEVLSW